MKKINFFVLVLAGQMLAQTSPVRFVSPYPITDGRFGRAIATLGDRLIVGAPNDTLQGIRSGAAYLIEAATGRTIITFRPRVLTTNANFGFAVATANGRVLIGAPNDDARGVPNAGAAYLFNATTGNLDAVLSKVTPAPGDSFGFAVAIAGDNLIIGTPRDDTGARDAGAVYYIDVVNAPQGFASRVIRNPAPGDFDVFGAAVAAIGTDFAVGVPSDSPTYLDQTVVGDAGSVYLYNSDGNQIGNFPNPTRSVAGSFGAALAFFENNILVGAPTTVAAGTGTPPQVGAAHLINRNDGTAILTVPNPSPNAGDRFGDAVGVVGSNILIGAPFDDLDGNNAGVVYRFDRAGAQVSLVRNPAPAANDFFGVVAAIDNDVVVGAPGKAVGGLISAGAVYRFVAAPQVSFSNTSLSYGNVLVNANADLTVRLTNTGTLNLAIGNTFLAGANANQFSIVAGGGVGVLTPNATRDITLRFSPTSVGNKIAFFVLNSNAASSPDTVTLTGAGVAPRVSFSSDSLKFGNVLVNANADLIVRLTNAGTANLSISSTSLAGANANQFSIITGGSDGTLTPNATRDITLRFSPASGGNKIAYFVLNSNAASTPDTVTLTGSGITAAPVCALSITSIRDGAQIIADSALVNGRVLISNLNPPFSTRVTVNGVAARVTNAANGARFSADVALPIIGANQLNIVARVSGSQSDSAICTETISIVRAAGTAETCVNFESLPFGTKFGITSVGIPDEVGDIIFRENGIPVSLQRFNAFGDIEFDSCLVDTAFSGFGAGQIMRLEEISLKLDFTRLGFPVNVVAFDYLDDGSYQNIAVNDGTVYVDDLTNVPSNIAPGVTLTVVQNGDIGRVTLTGVIRNLLIGGRGGQEFFIDNLCAQNITTCQLVINSPLNGATLCSDSVRVNVVARLTNVVRPFTIQFDVNGVKATFADTNLTVKVPLRPGANTLVATATVTDSSNMAVCVESVAVTRDSIARNLVINEILADPNYDDLGAEKIELKNTGTTAVLLDSTMALWIRRGSLDTYWTFRKNRVRLAPNQFFVIHWLGNGLDDDGNVFTGLPADGGNSSVARDGFWGDNSAVESNMTLGGVGNNNKDAFSIALVQNIAPGAATGFNNPCNLLGFVQICGRVPASESVAVEAGIWPAGVVVDCPKEGMSENLNPGGGYDPSNPSIGGDPVPPALFPKAHLLITEICVKPDNSEFVEIYNPTSTPIDLSDYYLTNMATDSIGYARLVSGTSGSSGFIVQFPATEVIPPLTFKTIAMEASRFSARYNVKPAYEIKDTDDGVLNMRIIPRGDTTYRLNDLDGALTLLNWVQRDSSDLVKDVDYVVWGEKNIIIVKNPERSPFEESANSQGGKTLAALKPPDVGINKTGLGIDGPDRNTTRSYYNSETAIRRQIPIANNPHADLKSWQRTNFLETGEKITGGNGLAGHDETSENLAAAFKEDKPTPSGALVSDPLDNLVYTDETVTTIVDNREEDPPDPRLRAVGFPNKVINPGEVVKFNIRLQNRSNQPTGPLFTILRALDSVVTMIDSTSNFPSIPPDTTKTTPSLSSYVLETDKVVLPDSLSFVLLVIQKSSGGPKTKSLSAADWNSLSAVKVKFIVFKLGVSNVTFDLTSTYALEQSGPNNFALKFGYTLKNVGTSRATGLNIAAGEYDTRYIKTPAMNPSVGPLTLVENGQEAQIPPFNLALVDSFKSNLTSFKLIFSWLEDFLNEEGVNVILPRSAKAPIDFKRPDMLEVMGRIIYYSISNNIKRPISGVTVTYQRLPFRRLPDTTLIVPPPFPVMTKTNGTYSFKVSGIDTGFYKITASLSGVPVGLLTPCDISAVRNLVNNEDIPPGCTLPILNEVYKKIAADVNRDDTLNGTDVTAITARINASTPFPVGKDWTFVDSLTSLSLTSANFFKARDNLSLFLRNYGRENVNFVGILYGDVDGSALAPPAGAAEGNPNLRTDASDKSGQTIPKEFLLSQNYPNPFNPTTRIEYGLPKRERVLLQIFNLVGQVIYTGVDKIQTAGFYQVDWNGIDQQGQPVPAGIYLLRLQAGAFSQVRKLALVK